MVPQPVVGVDSRSLEKLPFSEWVAKYGEEEFEQLVSIMFTTYCEDPIWQWRCSYEVVAQTVRKFLEIPDAWIVAIRYEGRLVSYGVGYEFSHYELAPAMLNAFEDPLLAERVWTDRAFLIDTISTVPEYQGNGAMKHAFAELQLIASSHDYSWLISWTSAANLTNRLRTYFGATGRKIVGTFTPPGYPHQSAVLLKYLNV